MNKKILIGSILAVVLLTLVSFSSVVGKVSSDEELVEFDVEFSGLGKKHTVSLTRQEADEVELLFDDIEQRLSDLDSREEAELIFKDAIVELNKYGLLGGLSVKQAQNLVTDKYQDSKGKKLLEKYYSKNQGSQDVNGNLLCLIAGKTSGTAFFSIFFKFFGFIQKMIFDDYSNPLIIPVFITLMISIYSPFVIGADIVFLPNAEGWVFSIGLSGVKFWNGLLKGMLPEGIHYDNKAIVGFNGFKIFTDYPDLSYFYLGTALKVDIEEI